MERFDDTGRILAQEQGSCTNKLLAALVVIAILLSSVALVVALISFHQNGRSSITLFGQQGKSLRVQNEQF